MRAVSLRLLAREAPALTEAVLVTHQGSVIGQFVPGVPLGVTAVTYEPAPEERYDQRPVTAAPKADRKRR